MGFRRGWMVAAGVVAASAAGTGMAHAAGPGNSDPAHLCLDGPQVDYFAVVTGDPATIDFGGLVHEVVVPEAGAGAYGDVVTDGHGQCVSFFAKNKGKGTGGKVAVADIQITKVVDKSSP